MPSEPDTHADLEFPALGLFVVSEYGGQPPGTTPVGTNVRFYEPLSMRGRGGCRPGLSRYISSTVAGTHLVQHLAAITDPTPRGLLAAVSDPGVTGTPPDGSIDLGAALVGDPTEGLSPPVPPAGTTDDPSTNNTTDRNPGGRTPRDGGDGVQPNRNVHPPPPPPVAYVQSKFGPVPGTYTPGLSEFGFFGGSARRTVTLDAHAADGNLLVAVVSVASNPAATIQVRNGALAAYTQAGTAAAYTEFGQVFQLSVWYRIASSGTQEDNVNVDTDQDCGMSVALLEFENVLGPTSASLDGFAKNEAIPDGDAVTTGDVAVSLAGDVLVAAFSDDAQDTGGAVAAGGLTLVVDQYDGTDMPSLFVGYRLGETAPTAAGEITYDTTALANAAGATFKQA